jgi:hypothetical protein
MHLFILQIEGINHLLFAAIGGGLKDGTTIGAIFLPEFEQEP